MNKKKKANIKIKIKEHRLPAPADNRHTSANKPKRTSSCNFFDNSQDIHVILISSNRRLK